MSETRERVESRADVLRVLREHEAELRAMGVERLFLFGSFARDEAEPGSDVDLLVDLQDGAEAFAPIEATRVVEVALDRSVDVTSRLGTGRFRAAACRDLRRVF